MSTTKVTDALRNVTAVDVAKITTGTIPEALIATLAASKLTGTVADARFPATLPAASGVNLTALNATNLGSGTTSVARGGTGAATHTANSILVGNGTSAISSVAPSTSGNVLTSNGSSWASTAVASAGGTTAGTVVATTSGTSVTFSSLPTGTKRIDVILSGVSESSGGIDLKVQIGDSGGIETSGYVGVSARLEGGAQGVSSGTDCFIIQMGYSASTLSGVMSLYLIDASTYTWVNSHSFGKSGTNSGVSGGGLKSLSAELTQVQFLIQSGGFDAGQINVHYWQ